MAVLRFFAEPETIYDCSSFICWLQFLICCNGFFKRGKHFLLNTWTRLYSLCFASIVVSGLASAIFYNLNDPSIYEQVLTLDSLVLSIFSLEIVMSTLVFVVTVISLQYKARQHLGIYARIEVLDRQLETQFGANLNYRKLLRKNIIVLTVVSVVYSGALNAATGSFVSQGAGVSAFAGLWCYIVVTGGPHFTGYVHINLVELLLIRFRLLQKIIDPHFLRWMFPSTTLREKRIETVVEMVKEMHFIVNDINETYKWGLWSAMAHDFTLSTSQLYIIVSRTLDGNMNFTLFTFVTFCMLPPFYKMLVTPVYCDHAIHEGRRCLRLIEMLDNWFPKSVTIKHLVTTMMSWRLTHNVEFLSGMIVVLNKTVISLFTSVVFNYLLILIQFHSTQKMGEQIEQQKVALQEWIGL